jgi:hypothetical protein
MIVLDANILLYASDPDAAHHKTAYEYLRQVLSGNELIGLPLHSISAFLRISTQRGVLRLPFSMKEAVGIVEDWLELPHVRLLLPGDDHWFILQKLLLESHVTGRSVTDAHIAALTIEYGGELQTYDRGFARFPGLRWKNPLTKR